MKSSSSEDQPTTEGIRRSAFGRDHALTAIVALIVGTICGYYLRGTEGTPEKRPPEHATPLEASDSTARPPQAGGVPVIPPQTAAGIQQLERLHAQTPDNLETTLLLGHAYYDTQQWDRARQMYELVLPSRPNDPNLLTDLGISYRNLGDQEKGFALLERASKVDPNHWQSRFNQAIVLGFDRREFAKAKAILAELAKRKESAGPALELEKALDAHARIAAPSTGR